MAGPAYALATASLEAFGQLEPGRWQIRDLDAGVDRQSLCLGDPILLAQLEHDGPPCAREIIDSGPNGGTVRYTCRGRGFGHSTIRIETPRLVKIRTQGIKGTQPFSFRAEARRVGDC
ncbi:MAG TPA: hypothetical protein VK472_08845 [Allosphingosinicella sp.]|nr:hypothetical protein [Allosphingosinicella sp.]